jgi:hypothetical protein
MKFFIEIAGGIFALNADSWYGLCTCILLIESSTSPIKFTIASPIDDPFY